MNHVEPANLVQQTHLPYGGGGEHERDQQSEVKQKDFERMIHVVLSGIVIS